MPQKTRIRFKDTDGETTVTSAWVVNAANHINQTRQFATDGVRYFYQPNSSSLFRIVNEQDLPDNARHALDSARSLNTPQEE